MRLVLVFPGVAVDGSVKTAWMLEELKCETLESSSARRVIDAGTSTSAIYIRRITP